FTVTTSGGGPMGGGSTETVWASKDVKGVDLASFHELLNAVQSLAMRGAPGEERKKIEGFPVLIETTRTFGDREMKSRDELVSVAQKEAPAGAFEVPADYTKKPFDPRARGGPGAGGRGRGRGGDGGGSRPRGPGAGGPPPASRPSDK